jgi:hypothetical protein
MYLGAELSRVRMNWKQEQYGGQKDRTNKKQRRAETYIGL